MTRTRILQVGLAIVLPIALVASWLVLSRDSTNVYFPPLSEILTKFRELWIFDLVPLHVVPSLTSIAAGMGISIVLGIGLGLLFGLSRRLSAAVQPILFFFRALPTVALLPMFIVLLGIGLEMRIAVIIAGALWPILMNTIDGVRNVDATVLDTGRMYQIRGRHRLFSVVLPSAAPQIFAGIRTSLSVSVIVMVASELVGSTRGIGYFILSAQRQFMIPDLWAGLILLGLIGYLLNVLFVVVERRMLAWHTGSRAS
ncbi:ABC transporter permease [Georgenia sp. H159]|uniref:ABC transporter permease n=1 Tax=Georgenia sp. H159 TaxID=3076115 RepID=UPI002D79F9E4|nr:ABC transporter permease [Georgenia sp. H159]